jgi:hypothetical protein
MLMWMLMDSAQSWLSDSYTLIQLHEEKELVQLPRFFCARTWDCLYVADSNMVTIWRKTDSRRWYKRAKVTYWHEIHHLPECDTLPFHYNLFIPQEVAAFHSSVDSLITLSNECDCFDFALAGRILGGSSCDDLRKFKDNLLVGIGEVVGERFTQAA